MGDYGIHAEPVPADLSTDAGVAVVERRLRAPDRPVHLLVNNAGISLNQPFVLSTADEETRLLRVNVHACCA